MTTLTRESSERRLERRRMGATLDHRLEAARRLATVSLLTGRPAIVRRSVAGRTPAQIALDEVADDVGLDALDEEVVNLQVLAAFDELALAI
jgi:hypothetical protein